MRDDELTDLLDQLAAAGLGDIPLSVATEAMRQVAGGSIIMDDLVQMFDAPEEKKDPVQEARKSDPLFGSW